MLNDLVRFDLGLVEVGETGRAVLPDQQVVPEADGAVGDVFFLFVDWGHAL